MRIKKIPVGIVILSVVAVFGITEKVMDKVKNDAPMRPGDKYIIKKDELGVVILAAQSGDLPAMRKLIYYFEQYERNTDKAEYWSMKARQHGDENEIRLYVYEMLYKVRRTEINTLEKNKILNEAHDIAKKLLSNNKNSKNEQLIQEVESEQARLNKSD